MRQSGFEPELLAWKARVIPGYTTGAHDAIIKMRPPGFKRNFLEKSCIKNPKLASLVLEPKTIICKDAASGI